MFFRKKKSNKVDYIILESDKTNISFELFSRFTVYYMIIKGKHTDINVGDRIKCTSNEIINKPIIRIEYVNINLEEHTKIYYIKNKVKYIYNNSETGII